MAELYNIEEEVHLYKVCSKCSSFNAVENSRCAICGVDEGFSTDEEEVASRVEEEYKFWEDDGISRLISQNIEYIVTEAKR